MSGDSVGFLHHFTGDLTEWNKNPLSCFSRDLSLNTYCVVPIFPQSWEFMYITTFQLACFLHLKTILSLQNLQYQTPIYSRNDYSQKHPPLIFTLLDQISSHAQFALFYNRSGALPLSSSPDWHYHFGFLYW